jgi:hypothetical protein
VEGEKHGPYQEPCRYSVIPPELFAEVEGDKYPEDYQRDHFLDHLELDWGKVARADAVGRYLEAVLKQGNEPTHYDYLPEGLVLILQMPIPSNGHEDV